MRRSALFFFFFFQAEDGIRDLTVTGVQTCALPICCSGADSGAICEHVLAGKGLQSPYSCGLSIHRQTDDHEEPSVQSLHPGPCHEHGPDRKSTRLNSSHSQISYAVFCLKKKKNPEPEITRRSKYAHYAQLHSLLNSI